MGRPRRRLAGDRRYFAFFHPALPDEPLIFVEVALVSGIASAVQPLLVLQEQPQGGGCVDTAIFYSISNCQAGLNGISFGNFLIKQVVMELQAELPGVTQFATLSPIPGFRRWLEREQRNAQSEVLDERNRSVLLLLNNEDWHQCPQSLETLRPVMLRLCAYYLCHARRGVQPLDPVARFHLGNGACLERLNWQGDMSENGLRQSFGMLVNYRYDLSRVERNHEEFINCGTVTTSGYIKRLLSGAAIVRGAS